MGIRTGSRGKKVKFLKVIKKITKKNKGNILSFGNELVNMKNFSKIKVLKCFFKNEFMEIL